MIHEYIAIVLGASYKLLTDEELGALVRKHAEQTIRVGVREVRLNNDKGLGMLVRSRIEVRDAKKG